MSVTLRQKLTNTGRYSWNLDIYHEGKRISKSLKLYTTIKPKTEAEKIHNADVKRLAEKIRLNTEAELINSNYSKFGSKQTEISFLDYFAKLTKERRRSDGTFANWDSTYKVLKQYFGNRPKKLIEMSETDLVAIRKFISEKYRTKSNQTLSRNAASSYFNKVKAAFNAAFDEKLVDVKIASRVKGLKPEDTKREFLTEEEVMQLLKTPCSFPLLKQAFFFSVFCGLRWSDVVNLKWGDIQSTGDRTFIRYRQEKTRHAETADLNNNAIAQLGERMADDQKVFKGLRYSAWNNVKLAQWVMSAGIKKHITFHCARHTFATLLLTKDIDIYTVSKLLGHRELKTTQIYGKVIDRRKNQAVKVLDFDL
ncbi:Site-specific recombinase XerD [Mucilaginibacter gossypiicola]|uniref:Site-specific recombinase XerD n=1 Tax=Mucilaginibacter gossypiicola TaxID=551995 RepID=A0A1H8UZT2_9SPHI|nr:site-specific integrase [Mucilaginibacter gossypiicola]SEP08487.1 Site-specific recombinase XerD [Mucilaginibacter gossypiicola]